MTNIGTKLLGYLLQKQATYLWLTLPSITIQWPPQPLPVPPQGFGIFVWPTSLYVTFATLAHNPK